jgi:pimeloyl-ACP methyl ester carboxylesterase
MTRMRWLRTIPHEQEPLGMNTTEVAVTGGTSTVEYLVDGDGPGLVLVHGTAGTPQSSWQPVIDALSDRYTIVAPTLSGSGGTTDPGGELTADDLATQVVAAADAAGLGSFHLVGHSLGAVVATAVAADAPKRVDSLFVHAGWLAADRPTAFQFDLLARLLRTDPELISRYILLHVPTAAAQEIADLERLVNANMPVAAARQFDFDARVDISDRAPAITAPTQVLTGRHDRIVPMRLQQQLAEAIPQSKQTILPTGHGFPAEQPDVFTKLLANFLMETESNR